MVELVLGNADESVEVEFVSLFPKTDNVVDWMLDAAARRAGISLCLTAWSYACAD